tara:strand:- start:3568 stop:4287 length:720 start_codon:yes stop_codon:yes gene_type:complete
MLSIFLITDLSYLVIVISLILFVYGVIIVLGSSFIQLNFFVNSLNKGEKGISLTFDDGPDPELTPKILDLLAKEKLKATFFVIGNKLETNKELLLRIHNEGHAIGNHSFSHVKRLTLCSTLKLKEDIKQCSDLIYKITKQNTLLFRPPFGITNPRYKRVLFQLNLKSIGWSVRSLDTVITNKELLVKKVTNKITNGSIVLFHDTQQVTLDALPDIIHFCKNNGINIVPLPELINTQVYD